MSQFYHFGARHKLRSTEDVRPSSTKTPSPSYLFQPILHHYILSSFLSSEQLSPSEQTPNRTFTIESKHSLPAPSMIPFSNVPVARAVNMVASSPCHHSPPEDQKRKRKKKQKKKKKQQSTTLGNLTTQSIFFFFTCINDVAGFPSRDVFLSSILRVFLICLISNFFLPTISVLAIRFIEGWRFS